MKDDTIIFNSRDTLLRFKLSQIIYFEADKNYTALHLSNCQKIILSLSLKVVQQYLSGSLKKDSNLFARVGKSHIINLSYLYQITIPNQLLKLYIPEHDREVVLNISRDALKSLKSMYKTNMYEGD